MWESDERWTRRILLPSSCCDGNSCKIHDGCISRGGGERCLGDGAALAVEAQEGDIGAKVAEQLYTKVDLPQGNGRTTGTSRQLQTRYKTCWPT